ncbi:Cyclic nucleotide-gated olfactory channel [Blyttiomyces sp. JEL0837]|nr:Cyclic nucleotide-gated olfactory channel [Blyttiomyces sp. JEL0837]
MEERLQVPSPTNDALSPKYNNRPRSRRSSFVSNLQQSSVAEEEEVAAESRARLQRLGLPHADPALPSGINATSESLVRHQSDDSELSVASGERRNTPTVSIQASRVLNQSGSRRQSLPVDYRAANMNNINQMADLKYNRAQSTDSSVHSSVKGAESISSVYNNNGEQSVPNMANLYNPRSEARLPMLFPATSQGPFPPTSSDHSSLLPTSRSFSKSPSGNFPFGKSKSFAHSFKSREEIYNNKDSMMASASSGIGASGIGGAGVGGRERELPRQLSTRASQVVPPGVGSKLASDEGGTDSNIMVEPEEMAEGGDRVQPTFLAALCYYIFCTPLQPNSILLRLWTAFQDITHFLDFVTTPLILGWTEHFMKSVYVALFLFLDIVFLLDCYVQSRVSFKNEFGSEVTDLRELREIYFRQKFGAVSLVANLPWELIAFVLSPSTVTFNSQVEFNPRYQTYKLWVIINLVKLLIRTPYSRIYEISIPRLALMLPPPNRWLDVQNLTSTDDRPVTFATQYLVGYLTALKSLVLKLRDVTEDQENIYVIFEFVAGILAYGTVFGNIHSIVEMLDETAAYTQAEDQHKFQMEAVKAYMREKGLRPELQKMVNAYKELQWQRSRGLDEAGLFVDVPKSVQQEIKNYLYLDLVKKVPIFSETDLNFQNNITFRIRTLLVLDGWFIFRKGDEGDEMYFIKSGQVDICGDNGVLFATLSTGSFFGEIALFQASKRTASARAKGNVELCTLRKDDFNQIMNAYPDIAEKIRETIRLRLEREERLKAEKAAEEAAKKAAEEAKKNEEMYVAGDSTSRFNLTRLLSKGSIRRKFGSRSILQLSAATSQRDIDDDEESDSLSESLEEESEESLELEESLSEEDEDDDEDESLSATLFLFCCSANILSARPFLSVFSKNVNDVVFPFAPAVAFAEGWPRNTWDKLVMGTEELNIVNQGWLDVRSVSGSLSKNSKKSQNLSKENMEWQWIPPPVQVVAKRKLDEESDEDENDVTSRYNKFYRYTEEEVDCLLQETKSDSNASARQFQCTLTPSCCQLEPFTNFLEYDAHYGKCGGCAGIYGFCPEIDTTFFHQYECFVEGCTKKFSGPFKRRLHLIQQHKFPNKFDVDVILGTSAQSTKLKSKEQLSATIPKDNVEDPLGSLVSSFNMLKLVPRSVRKGKDMADKQEQLQPHRTAESIPDNKPLSVNKHDTSTPTKAMDGVESTTQLQSYPASASDYSMESEKAASPAAETGDNARQTSMAVNGAGGQSNAKSASMSQARGGKYWSLEQVRRVHRERIPERAHLAEKEFVEKRKRERQRQRRKAKNAKECEQKGKCEEEEMGVREVEGEEELCEAT